MIKAVIFDLDGLLIDSEPLWRIADIDIFGKQGIVLTEDDCRTTTGMRVDEVVNYWASRFPAANLDCHKTENAIINAMGNLIDEKGLALPGVYQTISFFKTLNMPMAIASASSFMLINKVVAKLGIKNEFSVIESAEHMKYGKPHPEIFIETAYKLNAKPYECLVFEDSVYGVLAGKAAKMKVVAVPDNENYDKIGYCIADKKIPSLKHFNNDIWSELNDI